MRAYVGRFGGELKTVSFHDGDTVEDLLKNANMELGNAETINDEDGDDVSLEEAVEDGAEYYIVGSYKQGA